MTVNCTLTFTVLISACAIKLISQILARAEVLHDFLINVRLIIIIIIIVQFQLKFDFFLISLIICFIKYSALRAAQVIANNI